MEKYYHFYSKNKLKIIDLKEVIASSFHDDYQIYYNEYTKEGYILSNESFYDSLLLFHPLLLSDFGDSITFLVSYENTILSQYALRFAAKNFPSRINNISDIYLYTITKNDLSIHNYLNKIFESLNYDLMQTGLTFILSGLNATLAAKRLYIHRNTFNYRLNKFIEQTSLDIRDFDNALLLYIYNKAKK